MFAVTLNLQQVGACLREEGWSGKERAGRSGLRYIEPGVMLASLGRGPGWADRPAGFAVARAEEDRHAVSNHMASPVTVPEAC